MRRRVQRRNLRKRPAAKPVAAGWHSTGIVMVTAFLWWLLHWFSTVSLSCRDLIDWWFASRPAAPGVLEASSLLSVTLALWLYVDIVRPKPVRFPPGIRFFQVFLTVSMVVLNVFQWGFFRPQSEEGRIYAYFSESVSNWPVINRLLLQPVRADAVWVDLDVDLTHPAFDRVRALEREYAETFGAHVVPARFGVFEGRLQCEAAHELDLAWQAALAAYDTELNEAPEAPESATWENTTP